MRCGNMKSVAGTKHIISVRDNHFIPMLYGAYQHLYLKPVIHLSQRFSHKPALCTDRKLDQLNPALYEGLNLTGIREKQKPADLVCYDQFRINRHAQMQILFKKSDLSVINRVSHPGNCMPRSQPSRDQTAEHIAFICRCTCNYEICVRHICLPLNLCVSPVACYTGNIQTVNGISEFLFIVVNQHHVIIFNGQLLCKLIPHFSVTNNNYFHFLSSIFYLFIYSRAIIAPLISKYNINRIFLVKAICGRKDERKGTQFLTVCPGYFSLFFCCSCRNLPFLHIGRSLLIS